MLKPVEGLVALKIVVRIFRIFGEASLLNVQSHHVWVT